MQRRIRQFLNFPLHCSSKEKLGPQRNDAAFLTIRVYRTSHRSTRDANDAVLVSDMNSRVGADRLVRADVIPGTPRHVWALTSTRVI
jgi:hypothetical protein